MAFLNKYYARRFVLSPQGAKEFGRGVWWTTLQMFGLMLPAIFLYFFMVQFLQPTFVGEQAHGWTVLCYVLLALLGLLIVFLLSFIQYDATYTTVYDESATRRITLAEKLRKLPLAYFARRDTTDLTQTVMNDCTELEHIFSHTIPQLIASITVLTLFAIGLLIYDWRLGIALLWVVPLAVLLILANRKWLQRSNLQIFNLKLGNTELISEGIDNAKEIRAFHLQESYLERIKKSLIGYEKELTRTEMLSGVLLTSARIVLELGVVSVLLYGAYGLYKGTVDPFKFFVFIVLGSRILSPFGTLFANIFALLMLDVRLNRVREMQDFPTQTGDVKEDPDSFDITFENVDFEYEPGKQILHDVSFTAKQGEVTALIGPSGGGKSTCARVAARFWDVVGGRVLLGSRNLKEYDAENLLRHYSVVFQDVTLFNLSVMENIRIGRRNATDEEVREAARQANCEEFIQRLPEGYETVIGENGEQLSGGERQRISIARALLKDAPIVLLDEATASLDAESENEIQTALTKLVANKTVLIIAHRMRTISHADKLVVLEDGRVTEMGSPQELLKNENSYFSRTLKLQQLHTPKV